jgi:hypothetical protein
MWNRTDVANIPTYGVDPGQKHQIVAVLDAPSDVYQRSHLGNNNPQQIRALNSANNLRVTARFYHKLALTERGNSRLNAYHFHTWFGDPLVMINPQPGISYNTILERLKGNNLLLAETVEDFRESMRTHSIYRALIRPHFRNLFHRKENLDRATARQRSERLLGNHLSGKIDVCLCFLIFFSKII